MRCACLLLMILAGVLFGCVHTAPSGGLLDMEGALANRCVLADHASTVLARLRLTTHAPTATRSGAVNVVLVLDTSGSMEGQPIADARAASQAMVDALNDGDHLAVIAFGSRVEVLLPSTELDKRNRAIARKSLQAMKAEGTTDLAGGLRKGLDEAERNLDPHGVNRIVLVGDGVPNSEGEIRNLAAEAASQSIPITVLGLGPDYNETLMGAIAQLSGGQFHYARESTEVASFFKSEVLRIKQVYARNAGIDLTPGPGVRIEAVIGQTTTPSGAGVHLALGDISRADTRDLVVRLTADAHRDGATVELFDAVLTFDDAAGDGARVERRVFLGAKSTASAADIAAGRNPDVEDTAATMQAAATTVQAVEMLRSGENERAREVLDQGVVQADGDAARNQNVALRAKATQLRALRGSIPEPSPAPPAPAAGASPALAAPRPAPPKKPLPSVVREAHDDAMQDLL